MSEHAGQVVSIEEMLDKVWAGVMVTQDSVYQAIASLRRALNDDPKQPSYIVTVPRQGYKLIAEVEFGSGIDESGTPAEPEAPATPQIKPRLRLPAIIGVAVLILTVTPLIWIHATRSLAESAANPKPAPLVQRSIAVLPLLDLTDDMKEEPFADGMSEELIDKLSNISGLAVAPAASTFYYKDKQPSVAEVSSSLHVAYVLDGSVRKSGNTLRVAARLTRVEDGFVMWSETYDRSWSDKLMIQDDIAGEVAKALATSIR
jgi:TolB-like protein